MKDYNIWNEINETFRQLQEEMNSFFTTNFDSNLLSQKANYNQNKSYGNQIVDVSEIGDKVVVTVELPGMKKEDIDVQVKNNHLEIKAKSETKRIENLISLPCEVLEDTANAEYNNGILEISFVKKNPEKPMLEGKRIQVN